tara:strand:+ start:492 stop:641 length:150 start_codon:yes stop_codon:yes gene_type:complete
LEKTSNIKNEVDKYSNDIKPNECAVSKASTEIMLDRVCNGNPNEFPFSK